MKISHTHTHIAHTPHTHTPHHTPRVHPGHPQPWLSRHKSPKTTLLQVSVDSIVYKANKFSVDSPIPQATLPSLIELWNLKWSPTWFILGDTATTSQSCISREDLDRFVRQAAVWCVRWPPKRISWGCNFVDGVWLICYELIERNDMTSPHHRCGVVIKYLTSTCRPRMRCDVSIRENRMPRKLIGIAL